MRYVFVALSGGLIVRVTLFETPRTAVRALMDHTRKMNPEKDDAEVHGPEGLLACAKEFLDEQNAFIENPDALEAYEDKSPLPLYIIGNPSHPLGFMVASPDDPLGYTDPVEAICELGQMRKDYGMHLHLYRVIPVTGAVTGKTGLETHNAHLELDDFDCSLVEEYLFSESRTEL